MKLSQCLQNDINTALDAMKDTGSFMEPLGDNGFYIKRIENDVFYFDAFDIQLMCVYSFEAQDYDKQND